MYIPENSILCLDDYPLYLHLCNTQFSFYPGAVRVCILQVCALELLARFVLVAHFDSALTRRLHIGTMDILEIFW